MPCSFSMASFFAERVQVADHTTCQCKVPRVAFPCNHYSYSKRDEDEETEAKADL